MISKECFSPLLLVILLAGQLHAQAQRIMYVHEQGGCKAYDVDNVEVVAMKGDTVAIGSDAVYAGAMVDSITFVRPSTDFKRMGWWGNVANGHSTYNCQWDQTELPAMEMMSSNGRCLSAFYYFQLPADVQARGPRKVGRKWRYVRNTLTGRRQLQLTVLSEQAFDAYDADYLRLDLTPLLRNKVTSDVKRMVSYWHCPTESALEPSQPVIGWFEMAGNAGFYHTTTLQDSIRCQILFTYDDNEVVTGDSMLLSFPSREEAQTQFEQMDTHNDELTSFERWDNCIVITERFQATLDDVKRWLTRLDFEMAQPIFLRKE